MVIVRSFFTLRRKFLTTLGQIADIYFFFFLYEKTEVYLRNPPLVSFTTHLLYYCAVNAVDIHSRIYKINSLSCYSYTNEL